MVSTWVILLIAILAGILTWWYKRSWADAIALAALVFLIISIFATGSAASSIYQNGRLNAGAIENVFSNQAGNIGWAAFWAFISFVYLFFWALWKIFWVPRGHVAALNY